MYYMKLVRNSVASLFHMHAHSLQPFTVLTRCYLLSVHVLGIFLTTLNPKWLYIFFSSAFGQNPIASTVLTKDRSCVTNFSCQLQILSCITADNKGCHIHQVYFLHYSISALINEETSIGVSKVTSSSCHWQTRGT